MNTFFSFISYAPTVGMISPSLALLQWLLILVVAALPFAATLLGWIAVAQIRRSGGKLYGLGLAVFDGLLFPLLLLDAVLFFVFVLVVRVLRGLQLELSDAAGIALVIGLGLLALVLIAWLDFWIVRAVWRAVNKGLAPSVPSLGKSEPAAFQSLENNTATPGAGGRIAYVIFVLLYLLEVVAVLLSASQLPERVATHFGFAGAADGWMTRTGYVAFVLVFPLALALIFAGISSLIKILPARFVNIPNRAFWLAPERRATTALLVRHWLAGLLCLLTLFFAGLHVLTIVANQSTPPQLPMDGLMLIVIVFLLALMIWMTLFMMRFGEVHAAEKSAPPATVPSLGKTGVSAFPLDSARGRQSLENESAPPPVSRTAIVSALLVIGVVVALLLVAGADGSLTFFITLLLLLKLGLRVWLRRPSRDGAPRNAWAPVLNSLFTQFLAALPLVAFMLFIVPKFLELAKRAAVALPHLTNMVVSGSGILISYGWLCWLALALSGVVGWQLWRGGGAPRLRQWTTGVMVALFALFVVSVGAVLIPVMCYAPALLNPATAEPKAQLQVFELEPAVADALIPAAQRQPGLSGNWQVASVTPETLRALVAGRVPHPAAWQTFEFKHFTRHEPVMVDVRRGTAHQQKQITGWSVAIDSWAATISSNRAASLGSYQLSGSGWCGIRNRNGRLEARFDELVSYQFGQRPRGDVKIEHEGIAPASGAWVFLVPLAHENNAIRYLALTFEVQPAGAALSSSAPCVASYANGTVELVGLSMRSGVGGPCWRADGAPLTELPECFLPKNHTRAQDDASAATESIAVRVRSQRSTTATARIEFPDFPDATRKSACAFYRDTRTPSQLTLCQDFACPLDADSARVRVGVIDDWTTVAEWNAESGITLTMDAQENVVAQVKEEFFRPGVETMVQASDRAGVYFLGQPQPGSASGARLFSFPGMKRSQLHTLRVCQGHLAWVEFRNVSLQSGHRTIVEADAAPRPLPGVQASFGPTIERQIGRGDADGEGLVFFSAERNALLQPPFMVQRHGCAWIGAGGSVPEEPEHSHVELTGELKQWAAAKQVDFVFSFNTNGSWCYNALENRTRCIRDFSQPEQFDTITPAEAAASLDAPHEKAGRYVTSTGCSFGYDQPFRNMLAFRTRSGALGILQWSGLGAPANTLKLRYKLAPARNTPSAAPHTAEQASYASGAPQLATAPNWFTLICGAAALVIGGLMVLFAVRAGRKGAGQTPEELAREKARRRGNLALALCLGGLLLPLLLLVLGLVPQTRLTSLVWLAIFLLVSVHEIAAIVLGILGWKSGAGKAAVIFALLLPLLCVPGFFVLWFSLRASAITTAQLALEQQRRVAGKEHFKALLIHKIDQQLRQANIRFKKLSITLDDDLTCADIHLEGLSRFKNWTDVGDPLTGALTAAPLGSGQWEIRGTGQLDHIRFTIAAPIVESVHARHTEGANPLVKMVVAGERVALEKKLRLAVAQWFNENGSMCESIKVTTEPDLASATVEWRGIRNLQSSLAGESGMFLLKQTGVNEWSGSRAGDYIRLWLDMPPTVGLVIDGNGRPLPDVLVRQQDGSWQATTDANGRFPLPALTNNQQISLTLQAHGFAKRDNASLFRDSAGWSLQPVRFMLRRTATLTGRVIAPNDKPLAYAPLSLTTCWGPYRDGDFSGEFRSSTAGGSIANAQRAVTDDQGNWRMDDVPAGTHILYYPWEGPTQDEVEQGRWRALTQAGQEVPLKNICGALVVEARDGQTVGNLVLDLARSTCRITGRVLDQHGQPVVGAAVHLIRRATRTEPGGKTDFGAGLTGNADAYSVPPTDAEGRYDIRNFPPGDWKIRARLGSAETSGELRLTAAGEHATLDLCLTNTPVRAIPARSGASKPGSAAPPPESGDAVFGPLRELTFVDALAYTNCWALHLASGRELHFDLTRPPPDAGNTLATVATGQSAYPLSLDRRMPSLRAAHVDLLQHMSANIPDMVLTLDMRLIRLSTNDWNLTAADAAARLAPLAVTLSEPSEAAITGEYVYLFVTRDGARGILQLVRETTRLRYKLLHGAVSAGHQSGFGSVLARELLAAPRQRKQEALGLDEGRVLPVPSTLVEPNDPRGLLDWLATNRLDLLIHNSPTENYLGLHLDDGCLLRLPPQCAFDSIDVGEVSHHPGKPGLLQYVMLPKKEIQEQPVFLFQTREGGRGVLQITGFAPDTGTVKLRYKLVAGGAPSAAARPVVEAKTGMATTITR